MPLAVEYSILLVGSNAVPKSKFPSSPECHASQKFSFQNHIISLTVTKTQDKEVEKEKNVQTESSNSHYIDISQRKGRL